MSEWTYYIEGEPVSFGSGERERIWKGMILRRIDGAKAQIGGMVLEFTLSQDRTKIDIDNLCDPVFSAVINNKGWFGKRRPNMEWWRAAKKTGEVQGLKLLISESMAWEFEEHELKYKEKVLSSRYPKDPLRQLPKSLADREFAEWVEQNIESRQSEDENDRFIVRIQFGKNPGRNERNLGDIYSSRVKAIIDGLYPIFGRENDRGQSPKDWKVAVLQVERNIEEVKEDQAQIDVWKI